MATRNEQIDELAKTIVELVARLAYRIANEPLSNVPGDEMATYERLRVQLRDVLG